MMGMVLPTVRNLNAVWIHTACPHAANKGNRAASSLPAVRAFIVSAANVVNA
jgi:hypothetical protein